jgi:hypothetical protein
MNSRPQFPYVAVHNSQGEIALRPLLPLTLQYYSHSRAVSGLLDTGADVNVLPYGLGLELGAVWDEQQIAIQLSGNLANYEARGLILIASVAQFPPVKLAFAWTKAETVPLILGQVNFMLEFDVCFFRSRSIFEIGLKHAGA